MSITFNKFCFATFVFGAIIEDEEMTTNKGIINTPMTSAAAAATARRFLTNKAIIVLITVLWSSLVQFGCESAAAEETADDGEENMMR